MTRYRRTQLAWPLIGILGAVMAYSLWRVAFVVDAVALLILVSAVVLALFATLTVSLDDQYLHVRFGPGLIRRRFPLASIRSWEHVRNPWWWGYGIRYYFGGTLYNASGPLAIELTLNDGRRVRVGTNDPEGLAAALDQVAGSRSPLTPDDHDAIRRQAGRSQFRRLAIVAAVLVLVCIVVYVHVQAPTVAVSDASLSVRSGWYSAEIPFGEITSASLENELPPIELRTNGFAVGGTLRGNFRLTGLGTGQLFVNRGNPPFVVIKRARGYVVVNFEDPAETRRLFETLKAASPRLRTGR